MHEIKSVSMSGMKSLRNWSATTLKDKESIYNLWELWDWTLVQKTVGVAISDPLGFTAQGLEIIQINEEQGQFGFDRLKELVDTYKVERFVVGLPKNMNNTSGPRVELVRLMVPWLLKSLAYQLINQDERLTTVAAERMLIEQADISRSKRKKVIDKLAAQLILQNYLDRNF